MQSVQRQSNVFHVTQHLVQGKEVPTEPLPRKVLLHRIVSCSFKEDDPPMANLVNARGFHKPARFSQHIFDLGMRLECSKVLVNPWHKFDRDSLGAITDLVSAVHVPVFVPTDFGAQHELLIACCERGRSWNLEGLKAGADLRHKVIIRDSSLPFLHASLDKIFQTVRNHWGWWKVDCSRSRQRVLAQCRQTSEDHVVQRHPHAVDICSGIAMAFFQLGSIVPWDSHRRIVWGFSWISDACSDEAIQNKTLARGKGSRALTLVGYKGQIFW